MDGDSHKDEIDDDYNCDDEDGEFILKDSQLHRYLQMCQTEVDNVYVCHRKPEVPNKCYNEITYKTISEENMLFVQRILYSNLLLDEDVSFLFKATSNFIVEKKFSFSKLYAVGIFILGIICISMYFYIDTKEKILPFITGLLILLFCVVNNYYNASTNKKRLNKLIHTLQDVNDIVRKVIKSIVEDESLITFKEKLSNLSRGEEQLVKIHNYKKKMSEIFLLSSNIASLLKNLIMISQKSTVTLTKMKNLSGYEMEDYIAFCSDSQLGLDKSTEFSDSDYHHVAVLDNLKNIHLLMQSECLRILGLCLLNQCSTTKLFALVSAYANETSSVLSLLQNHYRNYFYPSFSNERITRISRKKMGENYIFIYNLARSLNSLLIDARKLEEYIEGDDNQSENDSHIFSSLTNIEKELDILSQSVKHFQTRLLKCSPKKQESEGVIQTDVGNSDLIENKIHAEFSDFSISGVDEVFLGCSDEGNEITDNTKVFDMNDEFKPPASLIRELKVVLADKRDEFIQREMKILKTTEEIEAYKSCLNPPEVSLKKRQKLVEPNNESDTTGVKHTVTDTNILSTENTFLISSQKDVAKAVSNLSTQWNNMSTVDYFGDDSNSE